MSTRNPHQLSPSLPFEERAPQTYDEVIAVNTRRPGQAQASEGLGRVGANRGAFAQGVTGSRAGRGDLTERPRQAYDFIQAGQANGRQQPGATNPAPAWAAVDDAMKAAFVQGDSAGEQLADPRPAMSEPRQGANTRPLAPTFGFSAAAERPGNVFQVKIAPANGGRGRRSIADVTEL